MMKRFVRRYLFYPHYRLYAWLESWRHRYEDTLTAYAKGRDTTERRRRGSGLQYQPRQKANFNNVTNLDFGA